MDLLRIYARVLALLGPEARLGWLLGLGNLALAGSQFAEPVLFGRIIDALAGTERAATFSTLAGLIAAWVGFGLFAICAGVTVALYADRLAHRRRHAVLTTYFEHVLQLPLSFHGAAHSGRLMKVMLAGTDALWSLWLDFFRDSFAATMMITIILPLSLLLNWQLGLTLMGLACIFGILTALVVAKTDTMQRSVEQHYSDLAERASDTLGNIALVQGYARVEAEVSGLRNVVDSLLAAQIPVLSWWALAAVITRASTTLTLLAIFITGIWLHFQG
jgi:ATP-binding cassette subfamily B protein